MTPNEATRTLIFISNTLRDSKHPDPEAIPQAMADLEDLSKYLTMLEIDYVNNNAHTV